MTRQITVTRMLYILLITCGFVGVAADTNHPQLASGNVWAMPSSGYCQSIYKCEFS